MIKILDNIKKIKNSNLVYLISKNQDLIKLDFLKLSPIIIKKIKNIIKKWKNRKFEFFLWKKELEKLVIFFYFKKSKKDLVYFLWKYFSSLENNITLLSNNNNFISLIDTCILSRYKFQNYKTKKEEDNINIIVDFDNKNEIKERISTLKNIIYARDLWETPSSDLTPEQFVKIIK